MPQPDEIAHWRDCVVFGWRETKAIVVIDLDEFEPPGTLMNPDLLADAIETLVARERREPPAAPAAPAQRHEVAVGARRRRRRARRRAS